MNSGILGFSQLARLPKSNTFSSLEHSKIVCSSTSSLFPTCSSTKSSPSLHSLLLLPPQPSSAAVKSLMNNAQASNAANRLGPRPTPLSLPKLPASVSFLSWRASSPPSKLASTAAPLPLSVVATVHAPEAPKLFAMTTPTALSSASDASLLPSKHRSDEKRRIFDWIS
ncbi:hypothetical protein E1B28_008141 [Marasmius oreades]|uniref:Uncharacterized protein n=1 Tax=Marasmius oreades TaxID=181124 RepID=A0A9P7RXX0_9AGAR|nr:uncharacterized protein E1B28_008141 [Marasmius oreades]KAG7091740.1 hypothetical protein E1B28_008141 [Marasmius oreades]